MARKSIELTLFLILALGLSACENVQQGTGPALVNSALVLGSSTTEPSATPSATATVTATPTIIPSPIVTVTPSPLPYPIGIPNVTSQDVTQSMGINIHFTNNYRVGEVEAIAAAGFHIARMDFAWSWVETTAGVYNFSQYDSLVSKLISLGIRPYFILDYGNALYTGSANNPPTTTAARQAFANFAAASAAHFQGKGIIWEIYNEPNNPGLWPTGVNAVAYGQLAIATESAIRAAAPYEIIVGPATTGKNGTTDGTLDLAFLSSSFTAGYASQLNALSNHFYRSTSLVPETANIQYQQLKSFMNSYSPNIPIFSGEWGYSTGEGVNTTQQAQYAVRQMLTNIANEGAVSILYDWYNPNAGSSGEQGYDIVNADMSPKPAYTAMTNLTQFLSGFQFVGSPFPNSQKPNDYVLQFTNPSTGETRWIAWAATASSDTINLTLPAGSYVATDVTGQTAATSLTSSGAAQNFSINQSPKLIKRTASI